MQPSDGWIFYLIAGVFVVLPGLIAALGLVTLFRTWRFGQNSVEVTGRVVEVRQIRHLGEQTMDRYSYQPVFEFRAPDGSVMRGAASAHGRNTALPIGSEHRIRVDLAAPELVRLSSATHWITGLAMVLIGAGCAAVGVMALMPSGGCGRPGAARSQSPALLPAASAWPGVPPARLEQTRQDLAARAESRWFLGAASTRGEVKRAELRRRAVRTFAEHVRKAVGGQFVAADRFGERDFQDFDHAPDHQLRIRQLRNRMGHCQVTFGCAS